MSGEFSASPWSNSIQPRHRFLQICHFKKSANEHLSNYIKKIIENDVERFKKDSRLLEMKEFKR